MHETTRLLRDLVRLPSVNPMGRPLTGEHLFEHRVTAYLENFCRGLGVSCERQPVAPQRDNLLARTDFAGPRRTLLFEVHQDTVPTDHMTIDPFEATIENGRLYGRGACDIKGGMAAMLTAFARLVREKPARAANVILACSVDEEHTSLGVRRMVQTGLRADGGVVAEPTRLQIVHAHKGVVRWHLTTTGRACHSSRPELGDNAIYHMARVLPHVERFAEVLRASRRDELLGPPTLSVGRIEGGTSANTVPDLCRVTIDRRLLPGEVPADAPGELVTFLREHVPADVPFACSEPILSSPALAPQGSEDLIRRLVAAIDAVVGVHTVHPVPFGTDASKLAAAGIPSVV